MMNVAIVLAMVLAAIGALYIRLRWHRSPQAYRAMITLATCYFVAGVLIGAWVLRITTPKPTAVTTPTAAVAPAAVATVPVLKENYTGPTFPILPLHYDPAHAVRPDPKLTPGDTLPGATADDVCTPGWATEHRHVTEAEKAQVYAQYPNWRQTCACAGGSAAVCCEVDHLIPLELGGSNDIKNLWPQSEGVRPGWPEKDQLENDLHRRVCKGTLSLPEAQKCIASDWVSCWKKYVVPEYGAQWAAENRHGW